MCDPHSHRVCFTAAPGSPHLHQYPSSPAPTKTRSTSSQRARRSAPSNSPAPCSSPRPLSPRRTKTTQAQRQAPRQRPRGPRCSTAPPLRSPRAPAQTTPRRNPARPQRLQTPRQTARPSARPEQSWPLAPGSTLATTDHHHWLSHQHLPLLCQGEPPSLCADPLHPPLSLHDVATMSRITTTATTKTRHLNVLSCVMSELSLAGKDLMVKGYHMQASEGRKEHYGWGEGHAF